MIYIIILSSFFYLSGCQPQFQWELLDNSPKMVSQAIIDDNNDLWFITHHGDVYYLQQHTLEKYNLNREIGNIQALKFTTEGAWIGTDTDLWYLEHETDRLIPSNKGQLLGINIRTIFEDSKGRLWVGTGGNGIYLSDDMGISWQAIMIEEGFSNFTVYQIYEDSYHHIWVASGGALYRYNTNTLQWFIYTDGLARTNLLTGQRENSPNEQPVLVGHLVTSIVEDQEHMLWIGTFGGVNRYDLKEGSWDTFTTEDGLIGDNIWAIQIDTFGHLWFGTNDGLSHYNSTTEIWTSYNDKNEFTDYSITTIAIDNENKVWASSFGEGLYYSVLR